MTFEALIRRIEEVSRSAPPKLTIAEFVSGLWRQHETFQGDRPLRESLLDAVAVTAAGADRPWLAGAAALQGAVHHLLAEIPHTIERTPGFLVSFCASEIGGNRPRSIETALEGGGAVGGHKITGTKRWATLSPIATHLVVIASEGRDGDRNHLRAVVLPADRAGVFIEEMTIPGGIEATLRLPHGLVNLEGVRVFDGEILPGDGYAAYLKPFRTVEDLYGCCARIAALLSLGFRHGAPAEELDGLIALLAALRAVSNEGLASPSSHLVVSAAEHSLPNLGRPIIGRVPPDTAAWWSSEGEVKVAVSAKSARRERALQAILSAGE